METVKKHKLISRLLALLYVFNLYDLIWTYKLVLGGYAREINPFMKYLLDNSPLSFVLIKIHLMMWVCYVIWKARDSKRALAVAGFATAIYGILATYQTVCLTFLMPHL